MKVLLLSAYTAASHQYWIDGLRRHLTSVDWTVLTLPARHFSWRIRGNSLTWAFAQRKILEQEYDCILASSMVDLAALRGMVPTLTTAKTIVYFHENQFVYPPSEQQQAQTHAPVEPQLVNLYSALCADKIVFNSDYNRQTFIQGVETLLRKLPDAIPSGLIQHLIERARVIPVPLDLNLINRKKTQRRQTFQLVWNHRWEYDKGPDRLFNCLQQVPTSLPLQVHVIGQQFRQQPKVFADIHDLLLKNNWLGEWGFVSDRDAYLQLLQEASGVLSTALHDFQGLSVLEAYTLGCIPIVPKRLAYPEFIPEPYCYESYLDDVKKEATAAANKIVAMYEQHKNTVSPQPMLQNLSWDELKRKYLDLFQAG